MEVAEALQQESQTQVPMDTGGGDKANVQLPHKKYYRQRAHSNPICDHIFDYPISPAAMDWSKYYPEFSQSQEASAKVEFVDIGCGYGGLLVELSTMFPEVLMLGLEIRVKVSQYVQDKIKALRKLHEGSYNNIACIRGNAMKYIPNFFNKGQFIEGYMNDLKQCVQKNEDGLIYDVEMRSYEIAVGALISVVYGGTAEKLQKYTGTDFATLSRNAKELNEYHQQLLEIPAKLAKWLNMEAWTGYSTKLHHNLTTCIKFGQMSREEILKSSEKATMRSHGLLSKTINLNADLRDIDDLLTDFAVDTKDPFAGTVMFVTHVLGMCPEAQEKIFEEVSQVYPENEPITYPKAKHLEYTEAFFKEAVRLYPVAAFTARVAIEDTVVGGYLLKPGTMIMYSTYVAHRDPRNFTEPLKVIPERWLNNGNNSDRVCDATAFAGFGLKARTCLGQNLATSIFLLYIANLVRTFKLTSAEFPEVVMRTVLYPKNPKPIKFELR